jgi:hypothetical protein
VSQWKANNCAALTDAACGVKFQQAVVGGSILGEPRPRGLLEDALPTYTSGTKSPHEYAQKGMICDSKDAGCTIATTFSALGQYPGPGAPGGSLVNSGSVSDIQLLGVRLGYVTHLVDPTTLSVVNITLPKQHGLDPGLVVRQVEGKPNGVTYVNSYGVGTGPNPLNFNVYGAEPVWGGNVNLGIRPIANPPNNRAANAELCAKFGDCK